MEAGYIVILLVKLTLFPGMLPDAGHTPYTPEMPQQNSVNSEYERLLLRNVVISQGSHNGYNHYVGIDPNRHVLSVKLSF